MEYNEKVEIVVCLPIVFRQTTGASIAQILRTDVSVFTFIQRCRSGWCSSGCISLTADVP